MTLYSEALHNAGGVSENESTMTAVVDVVYTPVGNIIIMVL